MTHEQDPIAHACRLLRDAAYDLLVNHTPHRARGDWTGEEDAKESYDDHIAAADALRQADRIKSSGQFTNLGELDAAAAELHCLHAENVALQQCYDAARLEIDYLRGVTKSKLLAQPVAWLVYLPSIDTQHVYDSQDDIGYVDDLTNHADAEVTPLYPGTAPKAEVAPAGEYPPLPYPPYQGGAS